MVDTTSPGVFPTNMMSPVYVGGLEMDALTKALVANERLLASQKAVHESQFWSTPRRPATDTTRDVFEVSLNATKLINRLTFDLAHFPHTVHVFYRGASSGRWLPLNLPGKHPLVVSVNDSIPAVIVPLPPGTTGHAQHYGAGHWVPKVFDVMPVKVRQIRVVLVRKKTPKIPVDRAKHAVSYSLGVRDFQVGYAAKSKKDIPEMPRSPGVITERDTFATTTDILGSPVSLSVRENRATDLLRGAMWRSEPQPISNAVVCLYVDSRDGAGGAQVIDRFYLEPTTTGASMNLYYSNDTPDQTRFAASDNPLDFPLSRAQGAVQTTSSGLLFPDGPAYVDLDNAGVQWNLSRPFWLGISLRPHYAPDDIVDHPIYDNGTLTVGWSDSTLRVRLGDAVVTYEALVMGSVDDDGVEGPDTFVPLFEPNQEVSFVVGYDGRTLSLYANGITRSAPVHPLSVKKTKQPPTSAGLTSYLRIGGRSVANGVDPGPGFFTLSSLILKAEPPPADEVLQAYIQDHAGFVQGGQEEPEVDSSDNALVRYLPQYQTPGAGSLNPLGFIGGPGNRYEDLVWTPINRDFRLAKGHVIFNPTKARFFKFEFTNLVPQPYDDFSPVSRTVKVFPVSEVYRSIVKSISGNTASGGALSQQAAASTLFFSDQSRLYSINRPTQPAASYIPTTAVYSTDPNVSDALRARSLYMNLQAWHARVFAPRFNGVRKHVYETVQVQHTQRVAFFVGLSKIQMSRVDYLVDDDTNMYLEPFSDATNLVVDEDGELVGGWHLDDGWLSTPDSMGVDSGVLATSKVFTSQRKVTAVQFATQQTPPVQILPDPDLEDPALVHWRGYGNTRLTPSDEFVTDIGTMVKVERDSTANYWATIEDRYTSWDDIEGDEVSWDDLESSGSSNPQGGITTVGAYDVSPEGRLYAAARVYSLEDLSAPLFVRITDGGGKVLSEEPLEIKAGQVAEWYTSYTIGEGGVGTRTWDQVEALGTWDAVEAEGTWDQVAQVPLDAVSSVMAQVVQVNPTADTWYVDNLSLFDDAIIWEFSRDAGVTWYPAYDIRNDPRGVFVFPPSTNARDGLSLSWRVRGMRPGQRVDYLAVRPWYDSLPMGQPYRETIQSGGPNVSLIDHYPAIADDPRWKVWHKPIPEEWWFVFRQWLLEQKPEPGEPTTIVVPNSIVGPLDEGTYKEQGYEVVKQVLLQSDVSDNYYVYPNYYRDPKSSDNYPFGPTATAVLEDGTFFVAVQMDSDVWVPDGEGSGPGGSQTVEERAQEAGFIRMWHLDTDLSVLGVHDEPWVNPARDMDVVRVNGNPGPFSIAVQGNKVVLLVEAPFDNAAQMYGDATSALFDTGSAYTSTPSDPNLTFVGAPTALNNFSVPTAWAQIAAANTTAKAGSPLTASPWAINKLIYRDEMVIVSAQLRINVMATHADPANISWKIYDTSAAYGSGFTVGGTGVTFTVNAYGQGGIFNDGAWSYLTADVDLTAPQRAEIKNLLVADHLGLVVDPGGAGERRVAGVLLMLYYGLEP